MPIVIKAVSKENYQEWLKTARENFASADQPQSIKLAQAQ
jgi:cytochrome c oxidase subunit 2